MNVIAKLAENNKKFSTLFAINDDLVKDNFLKESQAKELKTERKKSENAMMLAVHNFIECEM